MSNRSDSHVETSVTAKPIVAGVDGSTNNRAAIGWAFAEGARSGMPVKLLMVTERTEIRSPGFAKEPKYVNYVDHAYGVLDHLTGRRWAEGQMLISI